MQNKWQEVVILYIWFLSFLVELQDGFTIKKTIEICRILQTNQHPENIYYITQLSFLIKFMSLTKIKGTEALQEVDITSFNNLCFANNYNEELYMLLLTFSNLCYYIFNQKYQAFMLIKFILTCILTLIMIASKRRLDPLITRLIKFVCEIISISQLISQDEWNSLAILSLIFDKGIYIKSHENYPNLFDYLILKVLGLIYISLYWNNQVFIIILSNTIVLESYQILLLYSKKKKSEIYRSGNLKKKKSNGCQQQISSDNIVLIENQMKNEQFNKNQIILENENLINDEELWIKRMDAIPISIIILSKSFLTIKFKNRTANKILNSPFVNDCDINNFIMNKLEFTVVEDSLEMIRNSSCYIQKKKSMNQLVNQSYSSQFDVENLKKQSLSQIASNFKIGAYLNVMQPNSNSMDLYCHQILDSYQFWMNGTIFSSEGGDELTIILSDISKQMQLQQFLVKDEFQKKVIESLSHELRTPLNSSMNFIKSAIDNDQLPQSIKDEYLEPASIALQLQSYIINDVIDFSQFYNNNLQVRIRQFELKDVISEITSIFNIQFQKKGLYFSVDMTKNTSTYITTDQNRLMQILVNVLQNSLKYTSKGGAILKIKNLADAVQFSITDTGIGINSDITKKLNTYVNQVQNLKHFSKLNSWNGIGLLISSIILHQLNPQLQQTFSIKSKQNKGTKFKFEIKQIVTEEINYNTDDLLKKKSLRFRMNTQKKDRNSLVGTVIFVNENALMTSNLGLNEKSICLLNKVKGNDDYEKESIESRNFIQNLSDQYQLLENQPHAFILDIIQQKKKSQNLDQQSVKSSTKKSKIVSYTQLKMMEKQGNDSALQNFKKKISCQCKRIMSVDDEIFNQNSIKLLLERYGFEVIIAYNGYDAIQTIQQLQKCQDECELLHLILMDYSMPIMNGIECTKQLRRMMNEKIIPNINIVGLTAFTSKLEIESCLDAGMVEVLFKPFKLNDFCELLTLL